MHVCLWVYGCVCIYVCVQGGTPGSWYCCCLMCVHVMTLDRPAFLPALAHSLGLLMLCHVLISRTHSLFNYTHTEGLSPSQAGFFHSTNWIQYLNSQDKAAVADAFFRLLVTDYRKRVKASFETMKEEMTEATLKQAVATLQVSKGVQDVILCLR